MRYLLLLQLVCLSFISNAQLTYENTYVNPPGFTIVSLETEGQKFCYFDSSQRRLFFNNDNHLVFKTLPSPMKSGDQFVSFKYVSQHLFNTDDKIEYAIIYIKGGNYRCEIVGEDGKAMESYQNVYDIAIRSINGKTKLITYLPSAVKVYSAPGTYTGILPLKPGTEEVALETSIAPNPLHNTARISYQLPAGTSLGTIDVINQAGQQVRTYQVSNAFSDILISKDDLPAGMYLYRVNAGTYSSAPQKFIIQ